MKELALKIPGFEDEIAAPANIPSGSESVGNIILLITTLLVTAVLVASIIFTLYGGILWITSQGDKSKVDQARKTITYAIIGVIVMALSFTIIQVIGTILGISILESLSR